LLLLLLLFCFIIIIIIIIIFSLGKNLLLKKDAVYVKFVWHNLKTSNLYQVCNCLRVNSISYRISKYGYDKLGTAMKLKAKYRLHAADICCFTL